VSRIDHQKRHSIYVGRKIMMKPSTLRTSLSVAVISALATLAANTAHAATADSSDLSLEDLLKVEVTTASRKSQQLNDTAAAVFVITRDDIQRSGATTIPEALRGAPGVNVARMSANRYAVSVRGFNGRFANKLQVLVDGRSIYTPIFSGVMWELEDTLLEDVERIEVIRGPGGALWGANAVNAVINIITRKSRDTTGGLVIAGTGTNEHAFGAARYGGSFENGNYRIWAQANSQEPSIDKRGNAANDSARTTRAGFRTDITLAGGNRLMVSGAVYDMQSNDRWILPSLTSPTGITSAKVAETGSGGHVLARHEWALSGDSEAVLQAFVNTGKLSVSGQLKEERTTFDLDFQRRDITKLGSNTHDILWGLGHRNSSDKTESTGTYMLKSASATFSLTNAFIQDDWTVIADRLHVIGGLRIEHNNFTGVEPQPSARFIWTPSSQQSVWGALSRSIRTPSRGERDTIADLSVTPASGRVPAILTRRIPAINTEPVAEKIDTIELGYRMKLSPTLSIDIATFHSKYDNLRSSNLGTQEVVLARPAPYVVQNIVGSNNVKATSEGIEVSVDWQVASWWRLQPSYSYLDLNATAKKADLISEAAAFSLERTDPRHQISLRSSMTFAKRHQFDMWLRHVSESPGTPATGGRVPGYTELDVRYGWRLNNGLDLSVGGQNLLKRRHAEFTPDLLNSEPVDIERSFYVKGKLQFK
jgi:iron complex outermembrane recepter protein